MRTILIISVLLFVHLTSFGQDTTSVDRQFVFDYAKLLTPGQKDSLTNESIELEDSIGSQLVVLIIDTLVRESIEEYSLRIANEWGIGREGYDDGILITVVLRQRKMRIEVGDGLEKIISNETAAAIIREQMIPYFRQGKYYKGLTLAVKRIKKLIKENKALIGQRG